MLIRSKLFEKHHLTAVFSDRLGGVSPAPWDSLNLGLGLGDDALNVQQNLERLCVEAAISIPHRAKQVHGVHTLICEGEGVQHDQAADILMTTASACAVAVRTADCLPILLADPCCGVVAAVHAGWRGTAESIVVKAVKKMQQHGARIEQMVVALGPCIGGCCFEVGVDTAEMLAVTHSHAKQRIRWQGEKAYPDLQAVNRLQLESLGFTAPQMESISCCTACHPERFFSWRRDGNQSGRMLAMVALP